MTTILVIDDEVLIAEVVCGVLEDEGYQVLTASNGQQGLALIQQQQPELILADVMMPRLGGHELAKMLQADPAYHAIPIILMSAGVVPPNDGSYRLFLPKPFDVETLLHEVRRLLEEG